MLIATAAVTAQTPSVAITGVNVVDVVNGRIVPNSTVTISGQTITSVTRNGGPPSGARVVDGQGKFLIPGLWDMHAHIQGSEAGWLPLYVANGVTGIRDMGADLDRILATREATAAGRVVGPRIVAAGPILDDAPRDWPLRMRVKIAEDARAAVRLLKERGVDLIKVHNFTPRDAFFAIADEARRQNLSFAGHVPLKVTIEEAVDAGISSIEHLSEDGRVWKACSGGAEYRRELCRPFFETLAIRRHDRHCGSWQTSRPRAAGRESARRHRERTPHPGRSSRTSRATASRGADAASAGPQDAHCSTLDQPLGDFAVRPARRLAEQLVQQLWDSR
jgi:hypothetical protein